MKRSVWIVIGLIIVVCGVLLLRAMTADSGIHPVDETSHVEYAGYPLGEMMKHRTSYVGDAGKVATLAGFLQELGDHPEKLGEVLVNWVSTKH